VVDSSLPLLAIGRDKPPSEGAISATETVPRRLHGPVRPGRRKAIVCYKSGSHAFPRRWEEANPDKGRAFPLTPAFTCASFTSIGWSVPNADAALARDCGVDGIILSNHGGRQLDYAVSPMQTLTRVLERAGDLTVMIDSGFRRGTDVIKALALGAHAVFVGRPFLFAAAYAGEAGVAHAIALLAREIDRDMALLGVRDIKDVGRDMLFSAQAA
jgi:hypothetical protein